MNNLTEEEKKAINDLNFIVVTDIDDNQVNINKTKTINEYNKSIGIVLNLIRKQQKEIEYLSKLHYDLGNNFIDLDSKYKQQQKDFVDLDSKCKQQQEEIEELKNNELDYTTIYIDGVYEGKKYYKDKIRTKIKEVENGKENYKFEKLTSEDIRRTIITNLKELLEE